MREIPSGDDGDFSYKKLEERYNGDLANGLGNLVQRILTLIENNLNNELIYKTDFIQDDVKKFVEEVKEKYKKNIDSFALHEALGNIWELISFADKYLDDRKPWAAVKHNEKEFLEIMTNLVFMVYTIWAFLLEPFMPETAKKIRDYFGAEEKISQIENYKFIVKKGGVLFPRMGVGIEPIN